MGVIIDKIIFHSNIELSFFPYSFVVSPKMSIINMISVLMSSYEDMYEINIEILFRNSHILIYNPHNISWC